MNDRISLVERIAEIDIDAVQRWLEKPILQRVNAEILDAACYAARAIASGLRVQIEDDDINF